MNQAFSAPLSTDAANMSLADTQQALAKATALLRDAAMYVGSKACSSELTGEIYQFLNAYVPAEQMVRPAVTVYTSPRPEPLVAELKCGHCNVDRLKDNCASKSTLCSMAGAAGTLAAAGVAVACAA